MNQNTFISEPLLPKGYEVVKDFTIPLGITNKDLEVEGLEPENAEKLSIDVAPGKEKLNLYVFRPANCKDGEKTPVVYFIHGGGYLLGNTFAVESKIQSVVEGCNATVVSPDYTLTMDPSYKYPVELEEVYAGLHLRGQRIQGGIRG